MLDYIHMLFLWLILIQAPPGEFRTKISSIASEIKAYTLLERNRDQEAQEEFIIKHHVIEFQAVPDEKYIVPISEPTTLLKAIKSNKKIYVNCGRVEYQSMVSKKKYSSLVGY